MSTVITDFAGLQAVGSGLSGSYELGADIDCTGETLTPIGTYLAPFTGKFYGKGYTISNLVATGTLDAVGLFGAIDGVAAVNGVSVTGLTLNISTATPNYVGGLIGWINAGTVTNCNITGAITNGATGSNYTGGFVGFQWAGTISRCWADVSVVTSGTYSSGVGGFVASNYNGTIEKCYSLGSVSITDTNEYTPGGFAGLVGAGGGTRNPIIRNCYCRGACSDYNSSGAAAGFVNTVGAGRIENCYSTGAVNTAGGGFCQTNNATVLRCKWDVQTSGQSESYGDGLGLSTATMKFQSSFAGWDFKDIWGISPSRNDGYPDFTIAQASGLKATDIVTLEAVRNLEMTTMGRFYIDEQGNAKYESRFARNA